MEMKYTIMITEIQNKIDDRRKRGVTTEAELKFLDELDAELSRVASTMLREYSNRKQAKEFAKLQEEAMRSNL